MLEWLNGLDESAFSQPDKVNKYRTLLSNPTILKRNIKYYFTENGEVDVMSCDGEVKVGGFSSYNVSQSDVRYSDSEMGSHRPGSSPIGLNKRIIRLNSKGPQSIKIKARFKESGTEQKVKESDEYDSNYFSSEKLDQSEIDHPKCVLESEDIHHYNGSTVPSKINLKLRS